MVPRTKHPASRITSERLLKWHPAGSRQPNACRLSCFPRPAVETIKDAIEAKLQYFRNHAHMPGCCRRQLTEVDGGFNGIYMDDRKLKFHPVRLKEIFGKAPAGKRD